MATSVEILLKHYTHLLGEVMARRGFRLTATMVDDLMKPRAAREAEARAGPPADSPDGARLATPPVLTPVQPRRYNNNMRLPAANAQLRGLQSATGGENDAVCNRVTHACRR